RTLCPGKQARPTATSYYGGVEVGIRGNVSVIPWKMIPCVRGTKLPCSTWEHGVYRIF
ncbi:hypothetical protein IWQ61_010223, partial [Dispira simplex]